jgi:hypothetical protein
METAGVLPDGFFGERYNGGAEEAPAAASSAQRQTYPAARSRSEGDRLEEVLGFLRPSSKSGPARPGLPLRLICATPMTVPRFRMGTVIIFDVDAVAQLPLSKKACAAP